jgi:hypothetical protein
MVSKNEKPSDSFPLWYALALLGCHGHARKAEAISIVVAIAIVTCQSSNVVIF